MNRLKSSIKVAVVSLVGVVAVLASAQAMMSCDTPRPIIERGSQHSECGDDGSAGGAGGEDIGGQGGGDVGGMAGADVGGSAGGEAGGFAGAAGADVGGMGGDQGSGGAGGTGGDPDAGIDAIGGNGGESAGGAGGDPGSAGAGGVGAAAGGGGEGGADVGGAGGAIGGSSGAGGLGGGGTGGAGGSVGGSSGSGGGCGVSSAGGARGLESLTTFRVFSVIEVAPCALFITTASSTVGNLSVSTDDGHTWAAHPGLASRAASAGRLNALGEVLVGTRAPTAMVWVCTLTGCVAPPSYPGVSSADDITAISEDRGGVVWATSQNHNNLIHVSIDHGHTWTTVATPGQFAITGKVWTIEADPDYGLLVGGEIGTVMQSPDNGATWTAWGLPRPPYHGNLWSLAQSPVTGTLFAAVPDPQSTPNGSAQYHRLTDGPGVWHGVTGMANNWTDLSGFVFQTNGSVLTGGNQSGTGVIWKSTNDGTSWARVGPTGLAGSVRLHIGRGSGCLYFTDAGGGLKRNCAGY